MALRGVNLGGWLVVEKWMTPSLFEGTDATNEYELSQLKVGKKRLEKHHQSFITEDDWKWLQDHDIQIVRLPVGYWTLEEASPYVSAKNELDWAFEMAQKYDIEILLDLHAAPGAQNDQDHSGSGQPGKGSRWLKSRDDQTATIQALDSLAKRYGHHTKLWGFQLLNEPTPGMWGLRLAWFYRRAYKSVLHYLRPGTYIVFSDGYKPWFLTNTFGWFSRRGYPPVLDVHVYFCFVPEEKRKSLGWSFKLAKYSRYWLGILGMQQRVLVGEWSGCLPEVVGRTTTEEFMTVQKKAFEPMLATCYWSYKTEHKNAWNYRYMIETTPKR